MSLLDKIRLLNPEAFIQKAENDLYETSDPASPELLAPLHRLFKEHGFAQPPEIRIHPFFNVVAAALTNKNTIILSGAYPLHETLKTIMHEVGHLVFGDKGTVAKPQEYRADRFSHFIHNNTAELSEYIIQNYSDFKKLTDKLCNAGSGKKIEAKKRQIQADKTYGTCEERLANLNKPITPKEITFFNQAINDYNARVAKMGFSHPFIESDVKLAVVSSQELSHADKLSLPDEVKEIAANLQRNINVPPDTGIINSQTYNKKAR
jgi:hypothetical protein